MPAPSLIITIFTDRAGKSTMQVSLRGADGTLSPPREVILDHRLAAFVAGMQAFARQQLTPLKSPPQGRAGDGGPAVALEAADGKQVGERS